MGKGLRNGLGSMALSLLLACGSDGGGSGGHEDAGEDDAGRHDAASEGGAPGRDAESDADTDADTEPTDAEVDASGDAEPDGSTGFACDTPATQVDGAAGGSVESADGYLRLTLAPGALSADADVRVCLVPAAELPSALRADDPLGRVYFIDTAASFAGDVVFSGPQLPDAGSSAEFEPPAVRRMAPDGAPESASAALLTLADSTTLAARVAGPGFIYLRALDARAQYKVQLAAPAGVYVTGEVMALGAKVSVGGTPEHTRTLAVDAIGCDVETIEPTGVDQTTDAAPGCGERTTVVREGNDVDGTMPALEKDKVIDLTDADTDHPPPSFFCKFPGTGSISTQLRLLNGSTADLTVVKVRSVRCSYSGDIISAFDSVAADQNLVFAVSYTPNSRVNFTPAAQFAEQHALGADGFYELPPPESSLTPIDTIVASGASTMVTWQSDTDGYSLADDSWEGTPFRGADGGVVEFTRPPASGAVSCAAPSMSALGFSFGAKAGSATTVSFNDGVVDALAIAALGTANSTALGVQRWIRPDGLDLAAGKRSSQLLTAEQVAALPSGYSFALYAVNLFRVVWDEQRAFWPGGEGRVMPIVCGLSLRIDAAALAP